MQENAVSHEINSEGIDRGLFVTVFLLLGFGVVMIYSASAVLAVSIKADPSYFLVRQVVFTGIGIGAMLVGSMVNYHVYERLVYPLLAAALISMVLVHSPIGETRNGAARWIILAGISFQPAELMKIVLVLWLSYSLAKKTDKMRTFSVGFLPHMLMPGLVVLLCLTQPDFGTSIVLALVTFSLLFVAGAKLSYMFFAGLAVAPIIYYLVAETPYRLKRIMAYRDPLSCRFEEGFQLSQSWFGFGEGGLTGLGLGDGLQKFFFLPEPHNDFIVSIIAEELGVIAIWLLILVFAVLVFRGAVIAFRARDLFGTYIAVGLTILIGTQAMVNMAVAIGLLPTKGLTLPFVSYGGSSLVVMLYAIGILLNISKRPPALVSRSDTTSKSNRLRQDASAEGAN